MHAHVAPHRPLVKHAGIAAQRSEQLSHLLSCCICGPCVLPCVKLQGRLCSKASATTHSPKEAAGGQLVPPARSQFRPLTWLGCSTDDLWAGGAGRAVRWAQRERAVGGQGCVIACMGPIAATSAGPMRTMPRRATPRRPRAPHPPRQHTSFRTSGVPTGRVS